LRVKCKLFKSHELSLSKSIPVKTGSVFCAN
jgi:hypothetical protein